MKHRWRDDVLASASEDPSESTSVNGTDSPSGNHYDVVIAGARCAGAAVAMQLARAGLRVLAVDPVARGRDTLSTHALMRGAVIQLDRWGLLDAVREAGTPAIGTTTFHYGGTAIEIPIRPKHGVSALYAPRRTVIDPLLADAACRAGAEVVHGLAVVDLLHDGEGRVRGARIAGADRRARDITADFVIGADGIRSRVARLARAKFDWVGDHMAASIYGYWDNPGLEGYHWFYDRGAAAGTIPTNDGALCVFASLPDGRFEERRDAGLDALFRDTVSKAAPALADVVSGPARSGRLRAFPGRPGFVRSGAGPGWALVGDAGIFRDPITAHGITDALRDAAFVARAICGGGDRGLRDYQALRRELAVGMVTVTDRIASFEWDNEQIQAMHFELNAEMNAGVDAMLAADVVSSVA